MKIPHFLFRIINLVMITTLRSPLHGLFSGSILAMRYTGVKSGSRLTVPARFHRAGDSLQVVTSKDTRWWPNFVEPRAAEALVGGSWQNVQITAIPDNPNLTGPVMRAMWAAHPSDAAYMDVKLRDGEPDPDDFARALDTAVLVRIEPV